MAKSASGDDLDEVDLQLIRYLQDHPRATYSMISRATDVSETTVRRRVEHLMESRIITSAIIPNVYQLGYRTRAMVALKTDLDRVVEIARQIRAMPEVAFVSTTMGRWDILFFAMAPTLEMLGTFLEERIAPIEGIRETEAFVTPRVLKAFADWRVPIETFLGQDDASNNQTFISPTGIWLPEDEE